MIGRRQHGQAMSEFLTSALLVLVPLFIAITALGKLLDVQRTADMAARYAAWERTVWYPESDGEFKTINEPNTKTATEISREVGVRVFNDRSKATSIIRATDRNATTFANGVDPLWRDHGGMAFLDTYAQLNSETTKAQPTKDVAGTVLDKIKAVSMSGVADFVPPLPADTLAVADVTLNDIGKKSESYQRLWSGPPAWNGLQFTATGAILSNTWSANGRDSTKKMVEKMVPTAQPGPSKFVKAARLGLAPWDPVQPDRIEVGKIAVDVLPKDRLK